jgi:hypothetical protein
VEEKAPVTLTMSESGARTFGEDSKFDLGWVEDGRQKTSGMARLEKLWVRHSASSFLRLVFDTAAIRSLRIG